ncbi:bifunctional lysylphosphatidylglycerol flippase/synthetase MprF [Spirillospora sp. NPDC048911]|uniref:bifunctional lysylphosphatidylglycerol flippase/synthetase MprF n=1 Tax=Spirillospora sp. NPDC048911 TaxID=3364527 RepID=UPI00371FD58C
MTETLTTSDIALDAIRRYPGADNPSSFLAVNEGNSHLHLPDTPGVIVYRPAGRYLVQFGGPFAPEEARPRLLRAFLDLAAEQDREIVVIQLQGADAAEYLEEGFTVNQIGASYALRLDTFSLRGTAFMQLRNKIARALRSGMEISEAPLSAWHTAMGDLDAEWLGAKGGARPLEFLVGQCGGPHQHLRRLFVGAHGDRLTGYISYSPVYGSRPGWMHDLSRRRPDCPPGVMEAINKAAIETFQAEGAEWLHFGYTPFSGLSARFEFPGHSRAFQWCMKELWTNGGHIYPAQTQYAYKEKWKQDVVLPEYIAFQHGASIPALVHVFRACNAV